MKLNQKREVQLLKDEHPREGISLNVLEKLKTVFQKDGTVTAGNASGINDGAAAVVLMSKAEAEKEELKFWQKLNLGHLVVLILLLWELDQYLHLTKH